MFIYILSDCLNKRNMLLNIRMIIKFRVIIEYRKKPLK
jgi:hypothetical protein